MKYLLLVGVLFLFTGCASSYVPVYDSALSVTGEVIPTLAGYTKDASVLKEREVHRTLRNRDDRIATAHALSGTKLKFKMFEAAPGVYVQVLDEFTAREQAAFDDALPTAPSVHPVWETTENIVTKVADVGLTAFGINQVAGAVKAGFDAVGDTTTYNGNMKESFNGPGYTNNTAPLHSAEVEAPPEAPPEVTPEVTPKKKGKK